MIFDDEKKTGEDEICLDASLPPLKAYVIDYGASNHMVASRESFITFPLEDLAIIWEMTLKFEMLREVHINSIMMISCPLV